MLFRSPLGPGLTELVPLQASILDSAARLVRPGGRIVYATCSVLREENEGQVEAFLATHPDFTLVPVPAAWPAAWGKPPVSTDMLRLTPLRHDTDGFFAAVLERRADVAAEVAEALDAVVEPGGDEAPAEMVTTEQPASA